MKRLVVALFVLAGALSGPAQAAGAAGPGYYVDPTILVEQPHRRAQQVECGAGRPGPVRTQVGGQVSSPSNPYGSMALMESTAAMLRRITKGARV